MSAPTTFKYICCMQDGDYRETLYTDGKPQPAARTESEKLAELFLRAFSPERLTREAAARYQEEGFVLVFRTNAAEMEQFGALLSEYGATQNCFPDDFFNAT